MLFCNLHAIGATERAEHARLATRVSTSIVRSAEIDDGYALEVDASLVPIADLARWIDLERRCCSFFDFNLDWPNSSSRMTLRVTGPSGAKEILRSELIEGRQP